MSRTPPAAPEMCHHDGYSHSKLVPCPRERTAAPELPEGWELSRVLTGEDTHVGWQFKHRRTAHVFVISCKAFAELLATQGLSIVDAKDRAVLEACRVAKFRSTHPSGVAFSSASTAEIAIAELARREKP